jgi:protein-tyrosine phosphatase
VTSADLISIAGTYNFRDAGGYAAADGVVKRGVLFRSDGLHELTDAGRAELARLRVHTIIDLRDEQEASFMPDALEGLDAQTVRLPVFEGSGASQGAAGISLEALYTRIVTQHSSVVVEALRTIAGARDGAIVVHCTAGKDRTGVVIALALTAVGVDRALVVADYAATQGNLEGEWLERMVGLVGDFGVPDTPELRVLMGGSPAEALEHVLDLIERRHGTVREYLLDAGLGLGELADLETRLLDR